MPFAFNADEILTVAEQIERNGAAFYRKAADRQSDEKAKRMFLDLAAMEDEHEQTFATMRAGLTEQERKQLVFDPDEETPLYLRSLADRNVFDVTGDPWEKLSGEEDIVHILRFAIQMEKDSVVFYTGLKEMVPARFGGDKVQSVIKEELGHISTLAALADTWSG